MRQYGTEILISLTLVLVTCAVYGQVAIGDYEFVNFDDEVYVSKNPEVQAGLSVPGVRWAFTTFDADNWHPLTWLSLQLDATLYGLKPAGFHLTNLLLHAANAVLLFLVWRRLTGAVWPSALVAALFAVHPAHVESVAWIAERKDVLSTFFGLLALAAYAQYAERPALGWYLAVLLAFALSLLAKPMLVTLPFLLLLLDWWPLRRFPWAARTLPTTGPDRPTTSPLRLLGEKLPFLALSACASLLTILAQVHLRGTLEEFSVSVRIYNALLAYVRYLGLLLWPSDLAAFYEHPGDRVSVAAAQAAGFLLMVLTGLVLWAARRWPYLTVGWLWFVGTLVPVIGLVQVGNQALADRYSYVPSIGVGVMLAWSLANVGARWSCQKYLAIPAGFVLVVLAAFAWVQVHYWQDGVTLWMHAVEAAPNAPNYCMLGDAFDGKGRTDDAVFCYSLAIRLNPTYPAPYYLMALDLEKQGKLEKAARYLAEVVRLDPEAQTFVGKEIPPGMVHFHLGRILAGQGKVSEAVERLNAGARLNPDLPIIPFLIGQIHAQQGQAKEALPFFRRAVQLNPVSAEYHCYLAQTLQAEGDTAGAAEEYAEALRLSPDWPAAVNRRAWTLATDPDPRKRSGPAALQLALQVCQATGYGQAEYLDTLAAAYAEAGRFPEARATAQKALALASADRAKQIRRRLRLYEDHQAFHQTQPSLEATAETPRTP